MVTEAELFSFARSSFRSVWSIELLVLLRRDAGKPWRIEELVREMRSSLRAVRKAVACLQRANLIAEVSTETYAYMPGTAALHELADSFQLLYGAKPSAVLGALFGNAHEKLQNFADAFKLKE